MTDRIEPRAGEIGTGAFRGPYYNFVGRVGPYPQGPTTKGIHTAPDGEFPASELAIDDQTANEAPTTEKLLQTPPPSPREGEAEEGYDPLNPELEPEPSEPGVPVITEQPAFAYGDPGTGLENIHTEPPEGEGGGETPEPSVIVIDTPLEGGVVPPVHDVSGSGAAAGATVELWSGDRNQEVDPPNATTTADAGGLWSFAGDTPAVVGAMTWTVLDGTGGTASVNVTVEEEVIEGRQGSDWRSLNRHADLDSYLDGRKDLTEPEEWSGLTVADKKAWLDRNAR